MPRKLAGRRTHFAQFQKHNGTVDALGTPTYDEPADWDVVVPQWTAEHLQTRGGEVLRGRQVAAVTTDVLYGEYYGAQGVLPEMRCVIDGVTYEVVAALDMDGRHREMRVELRREY